LIALRVRRTSTIWVAIFAWFALLSALTVEREFLTWVFVILVVHSLVTDTALLAVVSAPARALFSFFASSNWVACLTAHAELVALALSAIIVAWITGSGILIVFHPKVAHTTISAFLLALWGAFGVLWASKDWMAVLAVGFAHSLAVETLWVTELLARVLFTGLHMT